MAAYRFLTTWLLAAPREQVWDAIYDAARWPEWWRGVERTEVVADRLWRSAWRSVFPYTLEFEFEILRNERPNLLVGQASGELAGEGVWRVYEGALGTSSTWEWHVETTARWMNALGPLAKPGFAWNHHRVMRWGAEGLARHLGVPLLAAS
ncbi:MAG: SRPBCC family protein [Gaiellaceae bacterium]